MNHLLRSIYKGFLLENVNRYTITLDDDPSVHKMIAHMTGINSLPFTSGESLLKRAKGYDPVATFIDVNLDTQESGIAVVPELRKMWSFTPIIVITGDLNSGLIGQALAAGANDFVRKPLNAAEVVARLSARVNEMTARRDADTICVGNVELSRSRMTLQHDEKIAYLPRLEFQILLLLLENRDMLVSRQTIKTTLWGRINVSENTLDKKISHIRMALTEVSADLTIESHYGKGFLLRINPKK